MILEANNVILNLVFGSLCGIVEDCTGLEDSAYMAPVPAARLATQLWKWCGVESGKVCSGVWEGV